MVEASGVRLLHPAAAAAAAAVLRRQRTMNRLVIARLQHLCLHASVAAARRSSCSSLQVGPTRRTFANGCTSGATLFHPKRVFALAAAAEGSPSGGFALSRAPILKRNTTTIRSGYAKDGERGYHPTTQGQQGARNSTSNPLESWSLWQMKNCTIEEIAGRRGLSEIEVYSQICWCVQQGRNIDWFDLCQEAGFTPAIVLDINRAKAEAALAQQPGQQLDELGNIPVQCGLHVTDVHVLLYNTMMFCGVTPEMLFGPIEERGTATEAQQPEAPPPKEAPAIAAKADTGSKRAAALGLAAGNPVVNGKESERTRMEPPPPAEETDAKKAPKRLTQKHMLQWMGDKDGATLLEIVLEFKDYNQLQLMRLVLLLERKKLIHLRQGIFRVTPTDEEDSPQ